MQTIVSILKDADVTVVDAAACCGSVVRDFLKTPVRVDFLPVTFMDPFLLDPLGSPNPVRV